MSCADRVQMCADVPARGLRDRLLGPGVRVRAGAHGRARPAHAQEDLHLRRPVRAHRRLVASPHATRREASAASERRGRAALLSRRPLGRVRERGLRPERRV